MYVRIYYFYISCIYSHAGCCHFSHSDYNLLYNLFLFLLFLLISSKSYNIKSAIVKNKNKTIVVVKSCETFTSVLSTRIKLTQF